MFKVMMTERVENMNRHRYDAQVSFKCQLEITSLMSNLGTEMIR